MCFPPGVGPPLAVGRSQVLQEPLLEDGLELQRLDSTARENGNSVECREMRIICGNAFGRITLVPLFDSQAY